VWCATKFRYVSKVGNEVRTRSCVWSYKAAEARGRRSRLEAVACDNSLCDYGLKSVDGVKRARGLVATARCISLELLRFSNNDVGRGSSM
jgi:hypothetical protein